jgi:hypothetical protein
VFEFCELDVWSQQYVRFYYLTCSYFETIVEFGVAMALLTLPIGIEQQSGWDSTETSGGVQSDKSIMKAFFTGLFSYLPENWVEKPKKDSVEQESTTSLYLPDERWKYEHNHLILM